MKTLFLATASLCALALSAAAHAEDAAAGVEELVVVATRSPQPADRIGQQVTVVDAAELQARQAVVVSDLLAETPGVALSRNGGVGGMTALRIRGAETDQTVVVVDGVKLNDPSGPGGGYNFANLMAGDIARIEVLRGAQSTLWGSQAIGGVVNIFTAEPASAFEGQASLEGGSLVATVAKAWPSGRRQVRGQYVLDVENARGQWVSFGERSRLQAVQDFDYARTEEGENLSDIVRRHTVRSVAVAALLLWEESQEPTVTRTYGQPCPGCSPTPNGCSGWSDTCNGRSVQAACNRHDVCYRCGGVCDG